MKNSKVRIFVLTAFIATLAFVGFAIFRIDFELFGARTAFHLANTFVVVGALLLGGVRGGLAGAIGLTLADLISGYIISAPTTFILKFMIGVIVGLVGHKIFSVNKIEDRKKQTLVVFAASSAGLLFNVIFDPLLGFIRTYILLSAGITEVFGKVVKPIELATALAKISAVATIVNATLTVTIVTLSYYYINNALKNFYLYKSGEK